MLKVEYSDSKIVKDINAGGVLRDQALKHLLLRSEYSLKVKQTIKNDGGSEEKSETVFETCLVRLDKKIRRHEWNIDDSVCEYLESEAKRIWCIELMQNDYSRKKVMEWINADNKLKKQIIRAIMQNSGKYEDAEDCFQNGLIYLDAKLIEGKYQGGAMKGYFYQICFNLWRNELKKSKNLSIEDYSKNDPQTTSDPLKELENKENADLLNKAFQELGESCQKIITLKYFIVDQFTMDEIARQMGFKNAQIASNTLNKCRKKLWEMLRGNKQATL